MSETTTTDAPVETTDPEGGQEPAKETDWKAEARKHEQRAKENLAKAKDNEAAAQRLAELENANKTEAEKAAQKLADAEKRAAELEAKANVATVANTAGIPSDILAGPASNSVEDLQTFADALIAFRGEQGSNRLHVPGEGKSPVKQVSDDHEFVKTLFKRGD